MFSKLERLVAQALSITEELRQIYQEREERNFVKVLSAMQKFKVSEYHFFPTTGYGYNDAGREALENVFAEVFGAESALVRIQLVSGTQAIEKVILALLKPGDELVSLTGPPYDTLFKSISRLSRWNILYKEVPLTESGKVKMEVLSDYISKRTRMVFIQRSCGYRWRYAITIKQMEEIVSRIKAINSNIIVFVDNCYGEFVDTREPPDVGIDIVAGSLIKNPGGTLAPCGAYICGKRELVEEVAQFITAAALGKEVGPTLGFNRLLFQGLFLAPHFVREAVSGAIFCSALMEGAGFETLPASGDERGDIVQAVKLNSLDRLLAFCQCIQEASPVDAHLKLTPSKTPGYEEKIIMAGGTFVQGGSLELSADAPLRPPFIAYFQGGTSFAQIKYTLTYTLEKFMQAKLLES